MVEIVKPFRIFVIFAICILNPIVCQGEHEFAKCFGLPETSFFNFGKISTTECHFQLHEQDSLLD